LAIANLECDSRSSYRFCIPLAAHEHPKAAAAAAALQNVAASHVTGNCEFEQPALMSFEFPRTSFFFSSGITTSSGIEEKMR